jgi:hypothetical protein
MLGGAGSATASRDSVLHKIDSVRVTQNTYINNQMSVRIDIHFKEEVSDHHDGYCSDGECELTIRFYKKQVEVEMGEITNDLAYYEKYADEVVCDHSSNSNWCDLSEDVVSAGLGRHKYRITILRVSLVDMYKKRNQRKLKRQKKKSKMRAQMMAQRRLDAVQDDDVVMETMQRLISGFSITEDVSLSSISRSY